MSPTGIVSGVQSLEIDGNATLQKSPIWESTPPLNKGLSSYLSNKAGNARRLSPPGIQTKEREEKRDRSPNDELAAIFN